jgi:prepilin-type processing-associated H-X9-DG protein
MYSEDYNDRVVPNTTDTGPGIIGSNWVNGWLTLDKGNNLGGPGPNWPDNTNTLFLTASYLWSYQQSLGVWRCPADKSLSTIGGKRYPHVRTMSMNNWVGDYDTATGHANDFGYWGSGFKIIIRISDMIDPAPVGTFVLLDERADSINDGYYVAVMNGFPDHPAVQVIDDYPSMYHNRAGGFSFADGHSEIHRWLDSRTTVNYQPDFHLSNLPSNPTPNDPDVLWLQQHATGKK